MQPVSFGKNSNAILSADESGIIFYWKDKENLANNCGGYLKGHASQVSRVVLAKNTNMFYSLGASDRTLIEWKSNNFNEKP
jgi:WD40 repeat protein